MRTLSQILIEADSAETLNDLERLWKEVAENREHFIKAEYSFAEEHFIMLTKKLAIKHLNLLRR